MGLKERLRIAEARAQKLEDVLLSKHGGEPISLINELDEAREQISMRDELLLFVMDKIRFEANSDDGICARIEKLCAAQIHTPK